jgi:acetyl-CoA C-acetyltransferase
MGHQTTVDGMILDGLWDPYHQFHMGNAAERCASQYQFSKADQDAYAVESYQRARHAIEAGQFDNQITPVTLPQRKGPDLVISQDEQPYKDDLNKLLTLKPAFQKEDGTITAGNASSINDGAAAVLLCSAQALQQFNLKPLAKIRGYSSHSQAPEWFTTAPVGAMQKLMQQNQWSVNDVDLFEINEAFSLVPMVAMKDLNLPHHKVNVQGGAVSLGHPIGASGTRIVVTLAHALHTLDKQHGLASICIGGGEALALALERAS